MPGTGSIPKSGSGRGGKRADRHRLPRQHGTHRASSQSLIPITTKHFPLQSPPQARKTCPTSQVSTAPSARSGTSSSALRRLGCSRRPRQALLVPCPCLALGRAAALCCSPAPPAPSEEQPASGGGHTLLTGAGKADKLLRALLLHAHVPPSPRSFPKSHGSRINGLRSCRGCLKHAQHEPKPQARTASPLPSKKRLGCSLLIWPRCCDACGELLSCLGKAPRTPVTRSGNERGARLRCEAQE